MEKVVPLISSGVKGPLGICHLPRLWQKALLGAVDRLAEGYSDVGPGYDHMVCDAIGIDPEKVREYIRAEKPSYFAFEAWLKDQPGIKLDEATIKASNDAVIGYNHGDDVCKGVYDATGLTPECGFTDAVNVNNFDDWMEFHASVAK